MEKSDIKAIISDYNWLEDDLDKSWVAKYFKNFVILDKYNRPQWSNDDRVISQENVGQNIYDMLDYVINNYESLPEKMIFARGCLLFPKGRKKPLSNGNCSSDVLEKKLSEKCKIIQVHNYGKDVTDGIFNYVDDGIYAEKVSSWWFMFHPGRYYYSHKRFLDDLYLEKKIIKYTRFSPGASYILHKNVILKYPKNFYLNLRYLVAWDCVVGEAHLLERNLYEIFTTNEEFSALYLGDHDKFREVMNKKIYLTNFWNKIIYPLRQIIKNGLFGLD